jgi:hypothetical protein
MPIRVAPTRSANRSILAKPLPSLPAEVESIPLPSSSTALQVSVALCASIPMTLSITASLVQMGMMRVGAGAHIWSVHVMLVTEREGWVIAVWRLNQLSRGDKKDRRITIPTLY